MPLASEKLTMEGWPEQAEEEHLKLFATKKGELNIESGCAL